MANFTLKQEGKAAKLDEQKLKELRTHHFNYGGYAPTVTTMNNLQF
jgi:hypothetical protein